MAYIENKVANEKGNPVIKHLMLVLLAGITLTGGMYFFSENREAELSTILMVVLIIGVLTIFVSKRLNPMAWKKLLNRADYEGLAAQEKKVEDTLSALDDSYFIFSNFSFELFHIDHLVVSENGFFVLGRVPFADDLNVKNNTLYAGDNSLETITAGVWRVCHLVNIIIDKGFDGLDIMPVPVLVVPDGYKVAIKEFNGIAVTTISDLNDLLTGKLKFRINKEHAEGFAVYIKQGYM